MATLTEASIVTRRIIRYGIYLIILIVIGRLSINTAINIYKTLNPAKEKPTVVFGKLPVLTVPEKEKPKSPEFILETANGELPKVPELTKVYFMPIIPTTIKALDYAREKAIGLGFNPNGRELVETVYSFSNPPFASLLTMNIVSNVFSISFDVNSDPQLLNSPAPSPENATSKVKAYLTGATLLPDDIGAGSTTTSLLKATGGKYLPAVSLSEANLTKVNLFRKAYGDKLPCVTPDFFEANIWFLVSGATETGKQIISAEYHYYPIEEKQVGTYPIKTAQKAWEELKEGKAYYASFNSASGEKITVRKVYLAYYDPGQYSQYLQPVYVFEGDNDFAAYIPAVTDEFYGADLKKE